MGIPRLQKIVEVYNLSNLEIEKHFESNGCVGRYAFDIYTSKDAPSKIYEEDGYIKYLGENEVMYISYVGTNKSLRLRHSLFNVNTYVGNTTIEEIIIPEYWGTIIYKEAFKYCVNLKSITICECLKFIEEFAFMGCVNLTTINYNGTIEDWLAIDKWDRWNELVPATYVKCIDGIVGI